MKFMSTKNQGKYSRKGSDYFFFGGNPLISVLFSGWWQIISKVVLDQSYLSNSDFVDSDMAERKVGWKCGGTLI